MTREEALFEVKNVLDEATAYEDAVCYITGDDREWLDMAIKALEQEPCEDCISRQAVLAISEDSCLDLIKALEQEPCEDCISRKAVLDMIDAKVWEFCDYLISKGRNDEQKPVSHFADDLRECIREDLPSVTSQPKIGRWFLSGGYWRCSGCKEKALLKFDKSKSGCKEYMPIKSNYCPNCGTKMQEVEK